MTAIFLTVLRMSLSASIVAVVVIIARLCLRKAPKVFSYALWSVVLLRLACPFSFSVALPFDWLPERTTGIFTSDATQDGLDEPGGVLEGSAKAQIENAASAGAALSDGNDTLPEASVSAKADTDTKSVLTAVLCAVWLLGVSVMLGYYLLSAHRLRTSLLTALLCADGVYETDRIASPFVVGVIRPRIYVPGGLKPHERMTVITHETVHIRRRDYLAKTVACIALAIHWFNPLVWLCYSLMCADMESSCDEAAMREMTGHGRSIEAVRQTYGQVILSLAERNSRLMPAAFSGNSTKERMRNIMRYKKAKPVQLALIAIACAALLAACAITPSSSPSPTSGTSADESKAGNTETIPFGKYALDDCVYLPDESELSRDALVSENASLQIVMTDKVFSISFAREPFKDCSIENPIYEAVGSDDISDHLELSKHGTAEGYKILSSEGGDARHRIYILDGEVFYLKLHDIGENDAQQPRFIVSLAMTEPQIRSTEIGQITYSARVFENEDEYIASGLREQGGSEWFTYTNSGTTSEQSVIEEAIGLFDVSKWTLLESGHDVSAPDNLSRMAIVYLGDNDIFALYTDRTVYHMHWFVYGEEGYEALAQAGYDETGIWVDRVTDGYRHYALSEEEHAALRRFLNGIE